MNIHALISCFHHIQSCGGGFHSKPSHLLGFASEKNQMVGRFGSRKLSYHEGRLGASLRQEMFGLERLQEADCMTNDRSESVSFNTAKVICMVAKYSA